MIRALTFALLAPALLAGCGALTALGDATTPLDAYDLRAAAPGPVARGAVARDLIVETPVASGAIDTDRILIRPHPLQAQYLPRARWADPAPVLVQGLLVRGLEEAGGLRYVGRRPLGVSGDFALISEITDFQAETLDNGATVRIRLSARLVREATGAIVASRRFEATAQAASTDTLDVVEGFEAAAAQLVPQVTEWALRSLGVAVAAPPAS